MASRSLKTWILAGAAVAVVVAVGGLLWQVRAGSSPVTSPAPVVATPPAPAPPARADVPRVDPAQAARPALAAPERTSAAAPSAGAAALRHSSNAELIQTLRHRADLLQQHVNDAELAGHTREAAKGRVALQRLRQRIAALGVVSEQNGEEIPPAQPANRPPLRAK